MYFIKRITLRLSLTDRASTKRSQRLLFVVFFSLLFLQSCFGLKTMYNWADTYIAWEVDSYFDLSDVQKTFVDESLDSILYKHRAVEVPKYIAFLTEARDRIKDGVQPEDMDWFESSLDLLNANIAYLLADDAVELLHNLDESQIVNLEEQLKERNEESRERYADRRKKGPSGRVERIHERIEEWMGELSKEQKERVAALYTEDEWETWFNHRIENQKRFVSLLRNNQSKDQFRQALLDWYLHPEKFYSESYKNLTEKWAARTEMLVSILDETASPAQREFLIEKLDGYISQLESILE